MKVICSQCKKKVDEQKFNSGQHACIQIAVKLPRHELLGRLLKSGGCSQAYYDVEMKKV